MSATLVFVSGRIAFSQADQNSKVITATSDNKLAMIFKSEEFRNVSRRCRQKVGEYEIVMKVDTSGDQLKILKYECKPLSTMRYSSERVHLGNTVMPGVTDVSLRPLSSDEFERLPKPKKNRLGYKTVDSPKPPTD